MIDIGRIVDFIVIGYLAYRAIQGVRFITARRYESWMD